jgi:hypothetical protein
MLPSRRQPAILRDLLAQQDDDRLFAGSAAEGAPNIEHHTVEVEHDAPRPSDCGENVRANPLRSRTSSHHHPDIRTDWCELL